MNPFCRLIAPAVLWTRIRLRKLFWLDSTAVELVVALVSIGWGWQFLDTQYGWAAVMILAGILQLLAVVVCSRLVRRLASMAMVMVWWAMAAVFWATSGGAEATTCTVLAVACTGVFVRLGKPRPRRR